MSGSRSTLTTYRNHQITIIHALVALLVFLPSVAVSQPATPSRSLEFRFTPKSWTSDSVFVLPNEFVVERSETLFLNVVNRLERGRDYFLDSRFGRVSLDSSFVVGLIEEHGDSSMTLSVEYRYFPINLKQSYYLRRPIVLRDTVGNDSIRVAPVSSTLSLSEMFGSDLQKSGSIFRGFTVGSNRDFSVNSGLRLQFSGQLTNDLEISASLTDENTPIQPEGTTQTLQEFDNVFVELRGTHYAATLGDFHFQVEGTEFGQIKRKLSGAQGEGRYTLGTSKGSTVVAGASTRGQFNSAHFAGIDGVQGPYRLTGKNGERAIIVIAGTERVYLDGESMLRGETNDYVIDYSVAEVRFTTRRPITSSSRIVVDYEYSDRQYSRSLLGVYSEAELLDNRVSFDISYFREADDQDNPIDLAITDSLKEVLSNAGNNRDKAVVNGVTLVDSNGFYVRIDSTLAGGLQVAFYRYSPGPTAMYVISFSDVGFGNGDYVRQGAGVFVWVGPRAGNYLPIRFLPLPEERQQLAVRLEGRPSNDLTLSAEIGHTVIDRNRFSTIDDGTNSGNAISAGALYAPRSIQIGGVILGDLDIGVKHRSLDARFAPIDRINEADFNRRWGADTLQTSGEKLTEGTLLYRPVSGVELGGGLGSIKRGDGFSTFRGDASLRTRGEQLPQIDYRYEGIRTDDLNSNEGVWHRHKGRVGERISFFSPFARGELESRRIRSVSADTLVRGTFRFQSFGGGFSIDGLGPIRFQTGLDWRTDDSLLNGALQRESRSVVQSYLLEFAERNSVSSTTEVNLRSRKPTGTFAARGRIESKSVLVRNQTRYAPLNRAVDADLIYTVSTERSARLERVFLKVAPGTGNYRYLGDLNGNGVSDESEFELTRFDGDFVVVVVPTEQLFPVIDLKTSLRLRLRPSLIMRDPEGFFQHALSTISTETYVRLDEKSTETELAKIYLLSLNSFLNDSTTIAGSNLFSQDIHFRENRPEFSARVRFSQRRSLNNFSAGIERGYGRERSLRIRWQLVTEIANQIELVNKTENLGSASTNRSHAITSNGFSFDLSYRPDRQIELGIKVESTSSTDDFQQPVIDAALNAQTLRLVYAFEGAGQARLEAGREELDVSRVSTLLPFELTGGRVPGKTWLWRGAVDYRLASFVQATLSYNGRTEGGRRTVHNAQAEVRAFF